ncbi:MAG: PilZ domain-containing protein [Thiogranum sp.]|nr:PilZ domain-containing protein [Thiogranum sp.]
MEHRRNKRISTYKEVSVEYPGARTFIGRMRNISSGGVFVELDAADLPPHALVKLLLPANGAKLRANLRIPVAVVRRTHDGIGLLCCDNDEHILKHVRT